MKAIVLKQPGDFAIETLEQPKIEADEVLIHIALSGICTNDIRDFRGDCSYSYPRIGGHEYCGTIEAMGVAVDTRRFELGQRVVSYIIDDCKSCYYCKSGQENICVGLPQTKTFQNPDGLSGYGGFAQYVVAKAEDLFVFPGDTPFEKMVFTEPLACVANSLSRVDIQLGDDVLVIGGGPMGLLHVLLAKARGARVILSEPLEKRREKALAMGCDVAIDPMDQGLIPVIMDITEGRGASVVFNTTALPAVAKDAVAAMSPGGICVMFSSIHPNEAVPVDMGNIHSFQKTITGAVSPTIKAYHQAVLLLGKGIIDPTPLIEDIYDYTEFGKAMDRAIAPDSYKVLLRFGQ